MGVCVSFRGKGGEEGGERIKTCGMYVPPDRPSFLFIQQPNAASVLRTRVRTRRGIFIDLVRGWISGAPLRSYIDDPRSVWSWLLGF